MKDNEAAVEGGELDLESQLDELASSLEFDLDDAELDDDVSAADAALGPVGRDDVPPAGDAEVAAPDPDEPEELEDEDAEELEDDFQDADFEDGDFAQAEPLAEAEPAAPESDLPAEESAAAFELDDDDVVELDSIATVEHLDDVEPDPVEDEPAPPPDATVVDPGGPPPIYLQVDGKTTMVDTDRFVIGRVSKLADLVIVDVNVSRQHCAIERRGREYYVVDLGSTNGVVIDGDRVDDVRIKDGDVLVLSGNEVRVSYAPPASMMVLDDEEPESASHEMDAPDVTGRMPAVRRSAALGLDPISVEPELLDEDGEREMFSPDAADFEEPEEDELEPYAEPEPQTYVEPGSVASGEFTPYADTSFDEHGTQVGAAAPMPTATPSEFEQRVEARLDQLGQQLAYVQQQLQVVIGQMQQLQGVASLATMIQQKMASRGQRR